MLQASTLLLACCLMVACGEEAPPAVDETPVENADAELTQLNKDILAQPNDANLYHKRAEYFMDKQMFKEAMADVDRSLAIDSTGPLFHYTKGEIMFVAGQVGLSRESFETSIKYDPNFIKSLLKLAELSFLLKDYEESLGFLDRVIKLDEYEEKAYYIKGFVFKELGDTAKAVSSFMTTTEINSDHFDAFMQLADLHAADHRMIAVEYFNSAVRINPTSKEALYNKGMFCQEHDLIEEAIESYDKILRLDSNHVLAYHNIGYVNLIYTKDYERAGIFFDKAIELQPKYVEAWHNRGLTYEKLGNLERAEMAYRRALEIKPDFDQSALGLSRILGEQ